jgi:1-acyl-sn-glycerol-3-phosphate acyltransferase
VRKILWILYQPYKWIILFPTIALSTLFFGSLAVVLVFIVSPRTASFLTGSIWARFNAFLTPILVKVTGRENVDKKQSYIVVSNHQSQYDIFVIYGWLGVDFKWIMKQELRKVPALGISCEKLGHIFIDRANHTSAIASLHAAKKKIVNGTSMMFFPEGTRGKDGKLSDFKKGAFKMAIDLDLPILPVTITGTWNILPSGTLNLFPGTAKLIIHKPIDIKDYSINNIQKLMEKTKEIIASGLPG